MKFNKRLFIFFIIICLCIFFGCSNSSFDKLVINCEDVSNIIEGEYTLIYSIKDYEKLSNKYSLTIKVKAFDQDNAEVTVKNNRTITVQKDYVYTVVVYCSTIIKEEIVTKSRQFVVTAEKSPPSINFILRYNNVRSQYRTINLEYNESLPISDVPMLPDWFPDYVEGIQKVLVSRKWVVYIDDIAYDLNQSHLNNITTAITVFGLYTFRVLPPSLIFIANGGSETPKITGDVGSTISRPANPVKNGATFDFWCIDAALTVPYNWKENKIFVRSYTLYAKWLDEVSNHIEFDSLNFEEVVDDYGNKYYIINAKNPASIPNTLTLPNGYNNIPIKKIANNGFQNSVMTNVYIPSSITIFGQSSFEDCTALAKVEFQEGNNMEALGWYSFKGCVSLKTITNFPQDVTLLGKQSFMNCSSLTAFTLPSNILSLQTGLFEGCTSLQSIAIPDSVVEILDKVFKNCTSLSSLDFTENSKLESIDPTAISNTNITSLVLPHFFSTITYAPFENTVNVTYHAKPPK